MVPDSHELPTFPVSRYRVEKLLGRGGMGEVLLARDLELDRPVAIKRNLRPANPVGRERFRREARVLAALEHPGVVRVLDFGEAEGHLFLVTEFLEGTPMTHWPEETDPLGPMMKAAEALEALHAAGVVHRDVKPDNLFHTRDGRTVLIDFGLVFDPERTRITADDVVLGSVSFMAPEVLRGDSAGPASDWFGWGATFYWLVERSFPQTWTKAVRVANKREVQPPPLTKASPRSPAARLIRATMADDPGARPSRVADLRRLIKAPVPQTAVQHPVKPRPRKLRRMGPIAGVVVLGAMVSGYHLLRGESHTPGMPRPEEAPTLSDPGPTPELAAKLGEELSSLRLSPEPDPAVLLELPRRLPSLGRIFTRVAERGADSLPADLRQALTELDVRFSARGLPRPFRSTLAPARPESATAEGIPGLSKTLRFQVPWTGLAAQAARRAETVERIRGEGEKILARFRETGELPTSFPQLPGALPIFGQVGLNHWLETAITTPEQRSMTAAWLRAPAEEMRAALALAFLAIREKPVQAEHVGLVMADWFTRERPLLLSEIAFFPPLYLSRGEPDSPPGWYLLGMIAARCGRTRRRAGLPWRDVSGLAVRAFRKSLGLPATPGTDPEHIVRRRQECMENMFREFLDLGEKHTALAVYREHARVASPLGATETFSRVVRAMEPWWREELPDPDVRADLESMLAEYDKVEDRYADRGHRELRDAIGRLRAELAQL